jgi:hypothetical protein
MNELMMEFEWSKWSLSKKKSGKTFIPFIA